MRISLTFFLRIILLLVLLFGIQMLCVFLSGKNSVTKIKPTSSSNVVAKSVIGDSIQIRVGTFLGNNSRNYYGDSIGNSLDVVWKTFLGKGTTIVTAAKGVEEWFGAGWTGQPLVIQENGKTFLIQGAFDHHLKKIDAASGEVIWNYEYDDILKGTGTIWKNDSAVNPLNRIVILQGSRKGVQNSMSSAICSSYRAVSFFTGKELWRMNVAQTASYSRDCDASALILEDTAYIGLENGRFVRFDPGKNVVNDDSVNHPTVFSELPLFNADDNAHHGGNLVTESSPVQIGDHIYITAGSGHVYGYNMHTKLIDWDFYIGSDLDGTPVVTSDSCLLVEVEKQYINGHGGIFKLNPRKDVEHCVDWYFPTGDFHFSSWDGGVIGSVAVNDAYNDGTFQNLAAFTGIDGNLNVVQYDKVRTDTTVAGPDGKTKYSTPVLQFRSHIGPSISTPMFTENKLVAAGYNGINLFSFNAAGVFTLLNKFSGNFEASPVADRGRIYIASRDGFLYCFGDTSRCAALPIAINSEKIKNQENSSVIVKNEKTIPAVKVEPEKKIAYVPIANRIHISISLLSDHFPKKATPDTTALAVIETPPPVKEKIIPKQEPVKVIASSPSTGNFHLIAGVFRSEQNAKNFEKLWKSRGMDASIFISPKGMFYVSIGNAKTESDLSVLMAQVKETYKLDAWVFQQ